MAKPERKKLGETHTKPKGDSIESKHETAEKIIESLEGKQVQPEQVEEKKNVKSQMRHISINITKQRHIKLKTIASENDKTISDFVQDWIDSL